MVEIKSIECNSIDIPNLNNQHFRLNKISENEEYFLAEIKERVLISKKRSKYISFFLITLTNLWLFYQ